MGCLYNGLLLRIISDFDRAFHKKPALKLKGLFYFQEGASIKAPYRKNKEAIEVLSQTLGAIFFELNKGKGGIRTLGDGKATPIFKIGAINHSATFPGFIKNFTRGGIFKERTKERKKERKKSLVKNKNTLIFFYFLKPPTSLCKKVKKKKLNKQKLNKKISRLFQPNYVILLFFYRRENNFRKFFLRRSSFQLVKLILWF